MKLPALPTYGYSNSTLSAGASGWAANSFKPTALNDLQIAVNRVLEDEIKQLAERPCDLLA